MDLSKIVRHRRTIKNTTINMIILKVTCGLVILIMLLAVITDIITCSMINGHIYKLRLNTQLELI